MINSDWTYTDIAKAVSETYNRFFRSMYLQACAENEGIPSLPRKKERVWYKPNTYYCKGFNFVILFYTRSLNELDPQNIGYIWYVWYYQGDKIYAFTWGETNSQDFLQTKCTGSFYIQHFFERYRQRFLKDATLTLEQVINTYFINNYFGAFKYVPSKKHPKGCYYVCNNGFSLLNIDHIWYEYKTFITWEMRFPDQKVITREVKESADAHGFDMSIPDDEFDDL